MKDLIKAFENLPFIVKIIISVFANIAVGVYRILKGADENNTTALVIGIVTLIFSAVMLFVDTAYLIVKGKYLYIDKI